MKIKEIINEVINQITKELDEEELILFEKEKLHVNFK